MKLYLRVRIDADIGQAQRERAGRATLMQPHLAVFAAILLSLSLIITDQPTHIFVNDNRRGSRRRRQIAQEAPQLMTQLKGPTSPHCGEDWLKKRNQPLKPTFSPNEGLSCKTLRRNLNRAAGRPPVRWVVSPVGSTISEPSTRRRKFCLCK